MNIMGGLVDILNFSVCAFASTGRKCVKIQHRVSSCDFTVYEIPMHILLTKYPTSLYFCRL